MRYLLAIHSAITLAAPKRRPAPRAKPAPSARAEYGKLGHDWGAWQSEGNNSEHVRTCQRDGCDAVDTASCSGDSSATCITLGTCTACGGQYYSAHTFPAGQSWDSDAENHWRSCTVCHEAKTKMGEHFFVQGAVSVCLKSAATCVSPAVYYTNCAYCYHKGTDTYVDPNNGPDPNNHDMMYHDAKAPTCTEIGWDAYDACPREGCDLHHQGGTPRAETRSGAPRCQGPHLHRNWLGCI